MCLKLFLLKMCLLTVRKIVLVSHVLQFFLSFYLSFSEQAIVRSEIIRVERRLSESWLSALPIIRIGLALRVILSRILKSGVVEGFRRRYIL